MFTRFLKLKAEPQELAYDSFEYINSFKSHGELIQLPLSKLWVVKRKINHCSYDFKGIYPFSSCVDPNLIDEDLAPFRNQEIASISFVSNPYDDFKFNDCLDNWSVKNKYKEHYSIKLSPDYFKSLSQNTRKHINRSIRKHTFQITKPHQSLIDEFYSLHENIIKKHDVSGDNFIDKAMVQDQFKTPNSLIASTSYQDKLLSAMLIFQSNETSYWYLAATHPEAYSHNSNYALFSETIKYLIEKGIRIVHLGGNAGSKNAADGLSMFKRKWANQSNFTYFCGDELNSDLYKELCTLYPNKKPDYFPAYELHK